MESRFLPPVLCDCKGDLKKKWFVFYYVNSKRIRVYGKINQGKTAKERQALAKTLCEEIIQLQRSEYKSKTQLTVDKFLLTRKNFWKPKTMMDHKSKVDALFNWLGFSQLSNETLRLFFVDILSEKSRTTYNNYRVVLKSILTEALQLNTVQVAELFQGIKSVKAYPVPLYPFPVSVIERLKEKILEECPGLWLVCQLQYYCFIRPNEIRHLKVSDVMIDEDKIVVHAEISKNKKTRFPVIPLAFKEDLKKAVKQRHFGEYLCPSSRGLYSMASENNYAYNHAKVVRLIGLEKSRYKLYCWKPTGMLQAVKNGASIKFIKEQAGHYSIDQSDSYLRAVGWRDDDNSSCKFPKI